MNKKIRKNGKDAIILDDIHNCAYIKWIDSYECYGWIQRDEAPSMNDVEIESIGFIVDETKNSIRLSGNITDMQFSTGMTIPKVSIIEDKRFNSCTAKLEGE